MRQRKEPEKKELTPEELIERLKDREKRLISINKACPFETDSVLLNRIKKLSDI